MKKSVLALAALTLASGAAMAQSSVTVFGIVDVAARSIKGADSVKYLVNEGRSASRLGFRGVEDLGGGMKASFHIEHGLNPDSGSTDSVFWQRRATVSLTGGFGEVRLGRHKTMTRTLIDDFDPFGTSGMVGLNRLIGLDRNRTDNQVMYYLPAMGGFYGSLGAAAGEGSNAAGTQRSMAGRVGYKAGAMDMSAAYGQYGTGTKLKIGALGASYDFGAFLLQGQYSKYDQGALSHKVANIAAQIKMGSGKLLASYGKASGIASFTGDMLAVGYDHSLSKRTTLYTTLGRIDNKNASTFTLGGATGRALPLAGGNSTGYEFGVRHTF